MGYRDLSDKAREMYTARVNAVMEAGEGSKTKIKEATDALNRFYEEITERANDADNMKDCWNRPFGLHQIRPKHQEFFTAEHWEQVQKLVDMREEIKAMPIVKREAKVNPEQVIRKSVIEMIEKNRENFDIVKATMEALVTFVGDETFVKGVGVQGHYCQNYFGTKWIRYDWYLRGRKVPFNHIMAAIDVIKREREDA